MPVEVTPAAWHYTTFWDWVDHWQTGIAGAGAVIAAFLTIWVTLRIERRQARRELEALRRSIAVELRLQIVRAVGAYEKLYGLSYVPNAPISAMMVESQSRMAAPIIYPANAGKIGLLGAEAMDVVVFYDLLEIARDGADHLTNSMSLVDISPAVVMRTADAFLHACTYGRDVLPRLLTGIASQDAKDDILLQKINDAIALQSGAVAVHRA